MSIEAKDITKKFGHFTALDHVDLRIPSGELVALLGPSGSGKTTLLRIIAGLEFADSGAILFDGEDTTHRNARDRRVGFVTTCSTFMRGGREDMASVVVAIAGNGAHTLNAAFGTATQICPRRSRG